jgi:tetratricopeptide (TPR) repeat protein
MSARTGPCALIVLVLWCGGCATYTDKAAAVYQAADAGDYNTGLRRLNKMLGVEDSDQLPDRWTGSQSLTVLERAVLLQATGQYQASARDLSAAEAQLEVLDLTSDPAGTIGKYVYSDSAQTYRTPPTERLALSGLNMLNYLALNDLDGAAVEARRFTVSRNYLESLDKAAHGAFGSYLAGFVFERLGEPDRALRYYEEALDAGDLASLREPILRLARRADYRGTRLSAYLEKPPAVPIEPSEERPPGLEPDGEILLVLGLGRVPCKVPQRIPIGAALGIAGANVTGDPAVLTRLALKVLVYPDLALRDNLTDGASVTLDGHEVPVELLTDLGAEIVREYEAAKPKIIGAALTRMIARAVAAEAARASLRKAGESAKSLAALAAEAALVALDTPDTRSWTLLPAHVYLCRVSVRPGRHELRVTLRGKAQENRAIPVDVSSGGFHVAVVLAPR